MKNITSDEIINQLGLTGIDIIQCKINPQKYLPKFENLKPKRKKKRNKATHWSECDLIITKDGGRFQVGIQLNSKREYICMIGQEDIEEIKLVFDVFKNAFSDKDLEFVKRVLKNKYNVRKRKVSQIIKVCKICGSNFEAQTNGKFCRKCHDKYSVVQLKVLGNVRDNKITQNDIDVIYNLKNKGGTNRSISNEINMNYVYVGAVIQLIEKGDLKVTEEKIIEPKIESETPKEDSSWINDFTTDKTGKICYQGTYIGLNVLHLIDLENLYYNYKGKLANLSQAEYPNTNKLVLMILGEHIEKNDYHLLVEKLKKEYNIAYSKTRR